MLSRIKSIIVRLFYWYKKYIYWLLLILSLFFGFCYALAKLYISSELFDFNSSNNINTKSEKYTSEDQLPKWLVDKIIYIEDRRFWDNKIGVDFSRIAKSIYNNTIWWNVQWWSTIDQQIVKISNWNYGNRWVMIKIAEILSAIWINLSNSKEQILLAYINNLPMTNNIVGTKSACDIYMSKSCENLTESEQYFIISIYQLGINPYKEDNFNKIKKRSKFLCYNFGWSDCKDIYTYSPSSFNALHRYTNDVNPIIMSYFDNDVESENTFDIDIYNNIQSIINNIKPHLGNNDAGDCCAVLLDGSGNLISMNICRAANDKTAWWQLNICSVKRQTWSAIKPFLYLLGMKKLWFTGWSFILDEPITYFLENNNEYQPKNFDLKYHGNVTISKALWNSLNIPAVKILHDIWILDFQQFILNIRNIYHETRQSSGDIYDDHNRQIANDLWLSMALGTYNFTPIEFANLRRLFLINDSESVNSNNINNLENKNILSSGVLVNNIYDILSDNSNRIISFGVDNRLNIPGWMSKSGTSRHFVDGWTCGANSSIDRVLCIWVGNFDNRPASVSSSQTASLLRNLVAKSITR